MIYVLRTSNHFFFQILFVLQLESSDWNMSAHQQQQGQYSQQQHYNDDDGNSVENGQEGHWGGGSVTGHNGNNSRYK